MHHAIHFHRGISTVDDSRSFGLLKTLYSHGIQYYTMVICLRLAVILGFYIAPMGMQLLFPIFVFYAASMMTSRFILSLQREMVNLQTAHDSLTKTSPDITFSTHGRSQTTQYPLELRDLDRPTNRGLPIVIVTDERDQFSTTEQSSFTANGQSSRSNHSGLVTRSLP
ncbi:hypothetical protein FRC20_001087 [Serendipita sp. 405]|nr:hypothetical protein FRC15_001434 [Serendipita sp. 397]KAG8854233.1 hypothetical protein FRC20_001087 [Serendipita sp. 405]